MISSESCDEIEESAYRIAGGAPAGTNILAGELGCLTNRTRTSTRTMTGNMMTTPRGTEMAELPRNRSGFLK